MDYLRYQASTCALPQLGIALEYGRMAIGESYFNEKHALLLRAFDQMAALEAGAIANPDEKRRVGHYWLRAPQLAPDERTRGEIEAALTAILSFTRSIHKAKKFSHFLLIGIGGSALGPQFIAHALSRGTGKSGDKMTPVFLDNTDPEGMRTVLASLPLKKTLVIVISKSGSTPETRNGMLEAQAAFAAAKLKFAAHAVAVTQEGSGLDTKAKKEKWIATFPMWDYVGGRTSVCSAVGLLPMALQGIDIAEFLGGAAAMDEATRSRDLKKNPAALMALVWLYATGGVGAKAMVVLPYKDRLVLFSKYLQQLIMESLGKANDLDGRRVNQGLTVYGNKGSTDQHAYVQQLRDGLNNFFACFIEVQTEMPDAKSALEVEPGVTSGDYLQGLCLGTTVALEENFRQSLTLILREVSPLSIGALIALFERAVGLYASLININAYHQPGVEAGKKAAANILALQGRIIAHLRATPQPQTITQICEALGETGRADIVYRLLERLSTNPYYRIAKTDPSSYFNSQYTYTSHEDISISSNKKKSTATGRRG